MRRRSGVSAVMTVLAVVVVAIIVGAGVYFATSASGTSAQTVTVNSTVTSTSTVSSSAAGNGAPVSLLDACKAEGSTVTVYTSFTASAEPTLVKDFNKAFPSITMNAVVLATTDLDTRATTEFQAGHVSADALSNGLAPLVQLNQSGVLQAYPNYVETLEGYPPGYSISPSYIHPSTQDVDLLAYNTKLVPNSSLPKTWNDLTNPTWSGKIAIDNPTNAAAAGEMLAAQEPGMGNASWTQFLKSLAANKPILTSTAAQALTDLTSGQASLAIVLLSSYSTAVKQGSPVSVVPGFSGVAHDTGISLAKNAPHPACGQLLIQWWTSYAGQEMIVQTGRGPLLPSVRAINATAVLGALPATYPVLQPSSVPISFYTDSVGFAGYYNKIFGGL
jgi:iron(III) transport system substrate-binding protein